MNEPLPQPDAQCRQYVHERLGFVRVSAECAQLCAEIGDDRGLRYHLERLVAHVRAATATYKELAAHVNREGSV